MTMGLTPLVTSEKCCTRGALVSHGSNWCAAVTINASGAGTKARHWTVTSAGQLVIVGGMKST